MDKQATLKFLNNCISMVYGDETWKEFNVNLKTDIRKWAEVSDLDEFKEPIPTAIIDIIRLRVMRDLKNNPRKIILLSNLKEIAKTSI